MKRFAPFLLWLAASAMVAVAAGFYDWRIGIGTFGALILVDLMRGK